MIGFGEAEAAYPLATGKAWQILLALCFVAIGMDGIHHQRRLHAHHGAVARVYPFDFPGNQTVADVIDARATVTIDGATQQPEVTHLTKNRQISIFLTKGLAHAW